MSLATRNNGCYECCKRRLKCDKTEPECLKCLKKGIKCSGQGLRCRFSRHMAPGQGTMTMRSKETRPNPVASLASRSSIDSTPALLPGAGEIPLPSNRPRKGYRWVDVGSRMPKSSTQDIRQPGRLVPRSRETSMDSLEEVDRQSCDDLILLPKVSPLRPALNETLNPQARMLFDHFSQSVAPVMVVLDYLPNGYRDIILPLACQDDVLGRAVSVVAAFHLSQNAPQLRAFAEAGHHAIVEKLRQDSLRMESPAVFNLSTLATILVLLVGETITGADNFIYLLEMLRCITESTDSTKDWPPGVRKFFKQQIKMFELFGFPLANETKGLKTLTAPVSNYLDFMSYPDLNKGSEEYFNMNLIRGAIQDACQIYRRRAESSLSRDESFHILEQLKRKVEPLTAQTTGAHALVWTYFIAAAESILPEHRDFFTRRLRELYQCTSFGSIPAALNALEVIWALQGTVRWTEVIGTSLPVLVM